MDDIVLSGSDSVGMKVKEFLNTKFKIKDLGLLRYFLGIEVGRSLSELVLSQRKYALDLLMETSMLGCKLATTPMDTSQKLQL
ncbi:reverse transcriptase domain-containing protein, partial [Mycobacterium kansasii]